MNLKNVRERSKLNKCQLARLMQVHPQRINEIEKYDYKKLTLYTIIKYLKCCGKKVKIQIEEH